MNQNALTLITVIEDRNIDRLKTVLKDNKEILSTLLRNIGTVHYARWVIIDGQKLKNETTPTQLVFSSNFDGDPATHIHDLVQHLGNLLDLIYSNSPDYTPQNKEGFLTGTRIKEAAFYIGAPGRSVKDIQLEKGLHHEIATLLAKTDWNGKSAKEIHETIQQQVFSNPQFEWAKEKIPVPGIKWVGLILFVLVLLILLPVIILWAIYMQIFHERFDKPLGLNPNQLDDKLLNTMQANEDFAFQNQFSQIIDMKPGKARLITVNGLYLFAKMLINLYFVKGKLMGIPTIHFARWVQVNDKKRMLFFSNFDGSWTQYLGDFIDKSGWGLTGIFGNTKDFPRAFLLVLKGAYNQRQFLAWARYTQIETQFWYVDDITQSIKNVNNNTMIRNELSSSLNETQAKLFLTRI
jgi:hypothetical protein